MLSVWQDVRYAVRQLRNAPGFTLTVVVTLALSVGVATAVFCVIDAVLLRPLPFVHAEKVVAVEGHSRSGYNQPASWPSFEDYRAQAHEFSALAGYADYGDMTLETLQGNVVSIEETHSTDNFFDVFGVKPLLGRTFLPGEEQDGRNQIVVLGYQIWQSQFGGDREIVGKTIKLNGEAYTVIGVMPEKFRIPLGQHDRVYVPRVFFGTTGAEYRSSRGNHWLMMAGRVRDGVSLDQAQAEMTQIFNNVGRTYAETDDGRTVRVRLFADSVLGKDKKPLWVLLGAVLAVLAIGCVNVAGLLLARGVRREREMAMRVAIGAGRVRLVRQVLTEALVLALLGALASIVFATGLLRGLRVFLLAALSRGSEVEMNWTVLAAALALAILVSVLAALYPALRMAGADPNRALKEGGRGGASRGQNRLRAGFIVGQVALTLTLLIVSGILLRTVTAYRHTDLGFDPHHILSTSINLTPARYAQRNVLTNFYRPLEARVRQIPGVRAAGIIRLLPIDNHGWNSELHIAGQPPYPRGEERLADIRIASAGYFDAMGIQLHRGRWLNPATDGPENKATPLLVNEAFVQRFIPQGLDPVTQKVDNFQPWSPIVGVTSSVRQYIYDKPMAEADYLTDSIVEKDRISELQSMHLVVRFDGDGKALTPALRAVIHEIDPTVPFKEPMRMDAVVDEALSMDRLESWLFGIFAGMAFLLAMVGLYGLISHEVEQGRREIGIRMALGALRGRVLAMVLRRVGILLVTGTILGLGLTYATRKLIGMVIYIDAQKEAGIVVGIALLLLAAGLLVTLAPGLRAASVEPNEALRAE